MERKRKVALANFVVSSWEYLMNTVSVQIAVIHAAICRYLPLAELRACELITFLFSFFPQAVEFVIYGSCRQLHRGSCVSPFPASERVPVLKLLQNTGVYWTPSFFHLLLTLPPQLKQRCFQFICPLHLDKKKYTCKGLQRATA